MTLRTIAKYYNPVDAQHFKSKLEECGIKCFLNSDASKKKGNSDSVAKLQVPEEDVMNAISILEMQGHMDENKMSTKQIVFCVVLIALLMTFLILSNGGLSSSGLGLNNLSPDVFINGCGV